MSKIIELKSSRLEQKMAFLSGQQKNTSKLRALRRKIAKLLSEEVKNV